MPQKFDNLTALDWDDTALIRAYDEGMALRAKNSESATKEEKRNSKKRHEGFFSASSRPASEVDPENFSRWRVGDFCRALYYGDNSLYEGKIVAIYGDTCIVEFLGYDEEEVEVELASLYKSHGKKSRKKQLKSVSHVDASSNGCGSADDIRNDHSASQSPVHNHSKRKHHKHHKGHSFNYPADHAANETTYNGHPMVHYNEIPQTSMMPPMCSEVAKDPSLCAMLTSWYMAGYYTGLHQAQRSQSQRCCCQPAQNYCH